MPGAELPREPQREIRDGPRQRARERRVPVAEVGGVAREQLVAPLAGQHHRHVVRGVPRQQPGGQHARVAQGLVHARRPRGEGQFALDRPHRDLVVLRADALCHAPGERGLVVSRMIQPQAERGEGPAPRARGQYPDQPRIDAAGQEHPERHIGRHARGDRARERVARGGDQRVVARVRGQRGRVRAPHDRVPRAPVAARALDRILGHQDVRGRQLPDRVVRTILTREAAVHEVARERGGRGLSRDPRQHEQRARLGGEREPAAVRGHEQRLLAGAVAGQRQRARAPVP